MITQQQIKEIKAAKDVAGVLELLKKWEDELYIKELSKKDKIEIQLTNMKGELGEKVVATPFLKGIFAFHKSGFGDKGYSITHVSSGHLFASGKLACVKAAIKYLEDNCPAHIEDIRDLSGGKTLRALPDDEFNIVREANHIARYGKDLPRNY